MGLLCGGHTHIHIYTIYIQIWKERTLFGHHGDGVGREPDFVWGALERVAEPVNLFHGLFGGSVGGCY